MQNDEMSRSLMPPLHGPAGEPALAGRDVAAAAAPDPAAAAIASTVEVLNLPAGIYAFTVQGGGGPQTAALSLPALLVSPAPIRTPAEIEFLCGPKTHDRWLTGPGDVVTVKISGGNAALLLTSLRAADSSVLSIDVRRLDAAGDSPVTAPALSAAPAAARFSPDEPLRITTLVHLPYLGDQEFYGGWAGRPSENLWIEGFSFATQGGAGMPPLLEYRGITEAGHETGWLGGGELCGNRGTGTPLVAFAVRLKPDAASQYTCRYSGQFLSGTRVGPLSEGYCRSGSEGDPLVGIELTLSPGG